MKYSSRSGDSSHPQLKQYLHIFAKSGSNPIEHSRHSGTVVPDCRFYQCPISEVIFWIGQKTRRNLIGQTISYVDPAFDTFEKISVGVRLLTLFDPPERT